MTVYRRENGEYDWCFTSQNYDLSEFTGRVYATFVGRKSYEMSLDLETDTNGLPKMEEYVFSNTRYRVKKEPSSYEK